MLAFNTRQHSRNQIDRAIEQMVRDSPVVNPEEIFADKLCEATKRRVRARAGFRATADTTASASASASAPGDDSFAAQLCEATRRVAALRGGRSKANVSRTADANISRTAESFGDELTQAVRAKLALRSPAARVRGRYHPLTQRPATASD
jgi:hypothetical protein